MTPELMELWLREFETSPDSCGTIDPAAIRVAASMEFPAMNSFSRCLLMRFAAICKEVST
jgi:hypothetical protein